MSLGGPQSPVPLNGGPETEAKGREGGASTWESEGKGEKSGGVDYLSRKGWTTGGSNWKFVRLRPTLSEGTVLMKQNNSKETEPGRIFHA